MMSQEESDRAWRVLYPLNYFVLGLMNNAFVPAGPMGPEFHSRSNHPLVVEALNGIHRFEVSQELVRVTTIRPQTGYPPPDMAQIDHPSVGLREWHALGDTLLNWLIREVFIRRGWEAIYRECANIPRAEFDEFGPEVVEFAQRADRLPPLHDFLAAAAAVAALPADAWMTIRRLKRAEEALSARASSNEVWDHLEKTYCARSSSSPVYDHRVRVMKHVYQALHREAIFAAAGETPTPRWEKLTGRLLLHHRVVLTLAVGKSTASVLMLDAFERQDWPRSITLPRSSTFQNIDKLARRLNGMMSDASGITFSVSDTTDRKTGQQNHYVVSWRLGG